MTTFIKSISCEWLKTKRTFAFWLSVAGGFFIPLLQLIFYYYKGFSLQAFKADGVNVWEVHYNRCWENMAVLLLPLGIILVTGLLTQSEHKNNGWKQLHCTPQSYASIFFAKYIVVFLVILLFFLFFNIGILLSGIIPALTIDGRLPGDPIPVLGFLNGNLKFLAACMPVIAIQYLMSLQFRNLFIPMGIGMMGLIGSIIAFRWQYIFYSPYIYSMLVMGEPKQLIFGANASVSALILFCIFSTLGYFLYLYKKDKS